MPLTFVDKKKRWPPPKPVQYILTGLVLIAAVAILVAWLFLRFVYTDPTKDTAQNDNAIQIEEALPGVAYCVVILEDEGIERFALVTSDPSSNIISVSPIAPNSDHNGVSLASILRKNGPAQTVSAIASMLNIPVSHYFSFSISDVLDLSANLGDNLPFVLMEDIAYKDENAATIHLSSGEHNLTSKQIAGVLHHTEWSQNDNYVGVFARLTASFINHYMTPDCSLSRYFKLLSETASTNIRIDHFNAYHRGLQHLAATNSGALADVLP